MNILDSLELLREQGYRITQSRKDILQTVKDFSAPISAREIAAQLPSIDRATVYRELSFLTEQSILRVVDLGENKTMYELNDEHCHHHLVCDNCGKITDIVLDEEKILSQIPQSQQFQIKRHSIEFFGLCSRCH